jgi:hypothetical protein
MCWKIKNRTKLCESTSYEAPAERTYLKLMLWPTFSFDKDANGINLRRGQILTTANAAAGISADLSFQRDVSCCAASQHHRTVSRSGFTKTVVNGGLESFVIHWLMLWSNLSCEWLRPLNHQSLLPQTDQFAEGFTLCRQKPPFPTATRWVKYAQAERIHISINQSIKVLLTCWSLTSIVMAMQALLSRLKQELVSVRLILLQYKKWGWSQRVEAPARTWSQTHKTHKLPSTNEKFNANKQWMQNECVDAPPPLQCPPSHETCTHLRIKDPT